MKLIQTLDHKNPLVFCDGNFCTIQDLKDLDSTGTWSYFSGAPTETLLGDVWTGGSDPALFLGVGDIEEWEALKKRKEAFLKSFQTSQVDPSRHRLSDILPHDFLREYYEILNLATENAFIEVERPENYGFLSSVSKFLNRLMLRPIKLEYGTTDESGRTEKFNRLMAKHRHKASIVYNMFGTVTGRLTTRPGTFPILNINKNLRHIIIPRNDFFCELDFNSAEPRLAAHLSGVEIDPEQDVYETLSSDFGVKGDRGEIKQQFFAWLYNPENKNKEFERLFSRDKILQQVYENNTVKTPFKRHIKCDDFHALNYLIQSTSSDNTLHRALHLEHFLQHKKTYIAFMIHDSIILDLSRDDLDLLPQIKDIVQDTIFGKMPVNVAMGPNFGRMYTK